MNNLTWFIYAVDVLTGLRAYVGWWLIPIGFVGMIVAPLFYAIGLHDFEEGTKGRERFLSISKAGLNTFVAALIVGLALRFIPSESTMYKMAASEIGEMALDNGGMETLQNLKKFIDKKLEDSIAEKATP